MTDTTARPIQLDFATDDTLTTSIAALDTDDRARLLALAGDHVLDRMLIDRVRAYLTEHSPTLAAIGVLFEPSADNDDAAAGGTLTSDGVVLFDNDTVDFVYFDDTMIEDLLTERWPNVGRNGTVAVDLRGEGSLTFAHADRDIYGWFNQSPHG